MWFERDMVRLNQRTQERLHRETTHISPEKTLFEKVMLGVVIAIVIGSGIASYLVR
jgi:hypothetical protein